MTYYKKTKRTELDHGTKQKTVRKGHDIDDPAGYPMTLHTEDELEGKISLQSYSKTDGF